MSFPPISEYEKELMIAESTRHEPPCRRYDMSDLEVSQSKGKLALSHKLLITIFGILLYSIAGGGMFLLLELPAQQRRHENTALNRSAETNQFADQLKELLANYSHLNLSSSPNPNATRNLSTIDTLLFLDEKLEFGELNYTRFFLNTSDEYEQNFNLTTEISEEDEQRDMDTPKTEEEFLDEKLNFLIQSFIKRLHKVEKCGHEMHWDMPNAVLYAWTIITTIGYGHIFPQTAGGRVATMMYAIVGIPLMLTCLSDLGKLLTRIMKFPWYICKLACRRMFRCCLGLKIEQIREAEQRDKQNLEVFDLPVPVAIGIVIGWTFVCSAIQMIWEDQWDYSVAFYFFFISITTIGLGDIAPKNPHYLLMLFGNILIGLSLLSMCINLIHSKFESAGFCGLSSNSNDDAEALKSLKSPDEKSAAGNRRSYSTVMDVRSGETHSLLSLADLETQTTHSNDRRGSTVRFLLSQNSGDAAAIAQRVSELSVTSDDNTFTPNSSVVRGLPPKAPSKALRRHTSITPLGANGGTSSSSGNSSKESSSRKMQRSPSNIKAKGLNDSFYDNHHLLMMQQNEEMSQATLTDVSLPHDEIVECGNHVARPDDLSPLQQSQINAKANSVQPIHSQPVKEVFI